MKIFFCLLVVLFLVSCGTDDTKPEFSCGEEVSLVDDIMPIINNSCIGCHEDNGTLPYLISTQAVIDNAVAIKREVAGGFMPPASASPLEDDEVDLIVCWVNDGAEDN